MYFFYVLTALHSLPHVSFMYKLLEINFIIYATSPSETVTEREE